MLLRREHCKRIDPVVKKNNNKCYVSNNAEESFWWVMSDYINLTAREEILHKRICTWTEIYRRFYFLMVPIILTTSWCKYHLNTTNGANIRGARLFSPLNQSPLPSICCHSFSQNIRHPDRWVSPDICMKNRNVISSYNVSNSFEDKLLLGTHVSASLVVLHLISVLFCFSSAEQWYLTAYWLSNNV